MMKKRPSPILNNPALLLSTVVEAGLVFSTNLPVTFVSIHNPARAPKVGNRFGQDLEPSGYYCLVSSDAATTAHAAKIGWETRRVALANPIVLEWTGYGMDGWKIRLSLACGKRTKSALTHYLVGLGFDGVVTTSGGETREVVILSRI